MPPKHNRKKSGSLKSVNDIVALLRADIWARIEVTKRGAYFRNDWSGNISAPRRVRTGLTDVMLKQGLLKFDAADRYHKHKTIYAISPKGMAV